MTTVSASSEIVNDGARPKTVRLCVFAALMTPVALMNRTASYGSDPSAYLKDVLGSSIFDERKPLLSIPKDVDKDIYGSGTHKSQFEQHIAQILGKQNGLFFLTGVQAQAIACKIYCEAADHNRVAWHCSSHLESAEERAYEALYQLQRIPLGTEPTKLPTVNEFEAMTKLPCDQRPAVILIEVPNRVLGCQTYTYEELLEISTLCREAGVKLHCDGARLWEIEPFYQETSGKSLKEVSQLFDSVYVSFYKGLGGIAGAMLTSNDAEFLSKAKMWQRRAGGNAFTLMYELIDCERGYNENIGSFKAKKLKMTEIVSQIRAATEEKYKNADGQSIVSFVPTTPTCCQIHTHLHGYTAEQFLAARDRVQHRTGVRVFERLRKKETVDEMMEAERKVSGGRQGKDETLVSNEQLVKVQEVSDGKSSKLLDNRQHVVEWMITSETEKVKTSVFVESWCAWCEELIAGSDEGVAHKGAVNGDGVASQG